MLSAWLELPTWLIFLTLAFGFFGVVAAIHLWSFGRWTRTWATSFRGVAPSYFSVPAVLLALLTGFVANDTWEHQRQAARIVQAEGELASALFDLCVASPRALSGVRVSLGKYAEAVLTQEWARMSDGGQSPEAAEALSTLIGEAAKPELATQLGVPTQSAVLSLVLRLGSERGERLALNQHRADGAKWSTLLILGLLTQMAIGIVHLDRPRAQIAALCIFTAGLVPTLGLIAIHEWPFDGPHPVKPTALTEVYARMSGS